jgi:high-affinity Fe2+/Pb2+ permease
LSKRRVLKGEEARAEAELDRGLAQIRLWRDRFRLVYGAAGVLFFTAFLFYSYGRGLAIVFAAGALLVGVIIAVRRRYARQLAALEGD